MTQTINAQQLLRGSRNIDQMRSEIHQIVQMILSQLDWRDLGENGVIVLKIRDKHCWTMRAVQSRCGATSSKEVELCYSGDYSWSYSYFSDTVEPMRLEDVAQVYDGLDVLVGGAIALSSSMKARAETLAKAAEKF